MKSAHEKAAIAIPYIIALVIGLIILAFIVYWVFKMTSSPTLSLQECKSRYTSWCSNCAQMDWPHWHCMPKGVWLCRETLQQAGFSVPGGDCGHFTLEDGSLPRVPRCDSEDVQKDCAALGVCLNNPQCD